MDNRSKRIYLNIAGLFAVAGSLFLQYLFNITVWSWVLLVVALIFMLASRYLRDQN